jgi:hypothetical protein
MPNILVSPVAIHRGQLVIYNAEFLTSLRDTPFCKDKPKDLPVFIDRGKINSESSLSRGGRRNRRQGSVDGDLHDLSGPKLENEPVDDSLQKSRMGHPGNRRDNMGWQPTNHQEHAEQFINRFPNAKSAAAKNVDMQGRIIPGKGVPRRVPDQPSQSVTGVSTSKGFEHQPALANVVSRQGQGFANFSATAQVQGGLDAFSMGDIRQAEKFLESGRMGLAEYARKVATGEINRETRTSNRVPVTESFFADEEAKASRPWLQQPSTSGTRAAPATSQGRIIPGYASQRGTVPAPPPPPQVAAPRVQIPPKSSAPVLPHTGKDSNAQGLALLQMLIEKKAALTVAPKTAGAPGPRQLTQQQINELISMSKRPVAKVAPVQQPKLQNFQSNLGMSRPVEQQPQQQLRQPQPIHHPGPPAVGQNQTPPHVAALLEQLHRQQLAQQQTERSSSGQTPPPECQQQ